MPTSLAQWTGLAVTAIVVLGTDMDVVYAVPLGFFAGALATFLSSLAEAARPGIARASIRTRRQESN